METIPFIYSMVTALKLSGSFLFLGFRRVCTLFVCFVLFGEEGQSDGLAEAKDCNQYSGSR